MKKIICLLLLLIATLNSSAQSGALDSTFGDNGKVIVPQNHFDNVYINEAVAVAIQKDGKIVTAGSGYVFGRFYAFVVTIHNSDGSPYTINVINPEQYEDLERPAYVRNVIVTAEGDILVTGIQYEYSNGKYQTNIILVKLDAYGMLKTSFGENGVKKVVINPLYPGQDISGIDLQTDGKIVISGVAFNDEIQTTSMVVIRLLADGAFDHTFNSSGKVFVNFEGHASTSSSVKIQDDGKIVAVGTVYDASTTPASSKFAIARLNTDGSFDNGFDADGKTTIDVIGSHEYSSDLAIQEDGRIIIGGNTSYDDGGYDGNRQDIVVMRLNKDGRMDNSFDGDGIKVMDFSTSDLLYAVLVQKDGHILLGGFFADAADYYFPRINITKLNADGSLDNSFDGDGTALFLYGYYGGAYDLALQPDNKIIAVGYLAGTSSGRAILRVLNTDFTVSCPANIEAQALKGSCDAIVKNIDPVFSPADAVVNYKIEKAGSDLIAGAGSVSGKIFQTGVSLVTYSLMVDPSKSCSFKVTVADTVRPVITLSGTGASPAVLWPANHSMQDVTINYSVADNCSAECKITAIISNEAVNGPGDGNTAPDWEYINNRQVRLRAERSGKGAGRLYTITITCTDPSGNSTSKNVVVTVPTNRRSDKETNWINSSTTSTNRSISESADSKINLSIYPNPVSAKLTVELTNWTAGKTALMLVNSVGAIVERKYVMVNQQRQTILFDMKKYTPGIYLLKLVSNKEVATKTIIVQR